MSVSLLKLNDAELIILQGSRGSLVPINTPVPGSKGPAGSPGLKGPSGPKGDRGKDGAAGSGVKYVRLVRTTCPSGAEIVYKGMNYVINGLSGPDVLL